MSLKQLLWSLLVEEVKRTVLLLLSFTAEDEVEDEGVTALVVCPFFEVGSIQALKDAHEIQLYEWGS